MANSVKMTRNLKQDMEEGLGYFDPEPVTELNVQDDDSVNSKLDYSTISKSQGKFFLTVSKFFERSSSSLC